MGRYYHVFCACFELLTAIPHFLVKELSNYCDDDDDSILRLVGPCKCHMTRSEIEDRTLGEYS